MIYSRRKIQKIGIAKASIGVPDKIPNPDHPFVRKDSDIQQNDRIRLKIRSSPDFSTGCFHLPDMSLGQFHLILGKDNIVYKEFVGGF